MAKVSTVTATVYVWRSRAERRRLWRALRKQAAMRVAGARVEHTRAWRGAWGKAFTLPGGGQPPIASDGKLRVETLRVERIDWARSGIAVAKA